MKKLIRKYYKYRIRKAEENIDLLKGIHNATEEQLKKCSVMYIKNKAVLDYYTTMLSVYQY